MTSVSLWQKPCYLIQNSLDHDLKATNFPRPTGYIKSLLAYVIDLQNAVKIPKILRLFNMRLANSQKHPVLKTILARKRFYVIPPLWNVQMSLSYVKPIGNKFVPKFHLNKMMKTENNTKVRGTVVMKAFYRNDDLSTEINIYCLIANQMPALLVQRAQWTRVAVMLVQSLYFSLPLRLEL